MTMLVRWIAGSAFALALMTAGCAKKQDETAKQLEETQKQLEEAKQQLAEAQGQAPGAAAQAAKTQGGKSQAGAGSGSAAQPGSGWGQTAGGKQAASAPGAPAAPAAPKVHTLAAGTPVSVRTVGAVSTKTSAVGEIFEATLAEPLEADGFLVAPKGARAEGVVTSSDPGGKVKGVATISVALRAITLPDGRRLEIQTGSHSRAAQQSKTKDAVKVGVASGIGAAIGAIAGGGKGAAIGAGAGAAGGTGVVLATRGDPAVIPAESLLNFKLSAPVTVQASK